MTTDAAQDPGALIEAYYERGLDRRPAGGAADATRRIAAMLAAAAAEGHEVLGEIAGRNTEVVAPRRSRSTR